MLLDVPVTCQSGPHISSGIVAMPPNGLFSHRRHTASSPTGLLKDRLQSQHSPHKPSGCAPPLQPRPPTLRPISFHSLPRLLLMRPLELLSQKGFPKICRPIKHWLGYSTSQFLFSHSLFVFSLCLAPVSLTTEILRTLPPRGRVPFFS